MERGQRASDDHLLGEKACSFVAIQLRSVSPATAVPCVGEGWRNEGVNRKKDKEEDMEGK